MRLRSSSPSEVQVNSIKHLAAAFILAASGCGAKSDGEQFSAYAISNTTLKGAFAVSRATAADAERQAIAACEASAGDGLPCRQVLWFTEGCGAIAVGARLKTNVADWAEASRNGDLLQIGNGVGEDAVGACADALRICRAAGGVNCGAREVACMDTGVAGACPPAASLDVAAPASGGEVGYIGYAFSNAARSGAFAISNQSLADARKQAIEECNDAAGGDCAALGAFEAACAAIAKGAGDGVSLAPGADAKSACVAAVTTCEDGGASCSGVTYACARGEPGFCKEL